jgi:hypothetical protein
MLPYLAFSSFIAACFTGTCASSYKPRGSREVVTRSRRLRSRSYFYSCHQVHPGAHVREEWRSNLFLL